MEGLAAARGRVKSLSCATVRNRFWVVGFGLLVFVEGKSIFYNYSSVSAAGSVFMQSNLSIQHTRRWVVEKSLFWNSSSFSPICKWFFPSLSHFKFYSWRSLLLLHFFSAALHYRQYFNIHRHMAWSIYGTIAMTMRMIRIRAIKEAVNQCELFVFHHRIYVFQHLLKRYDIFVCFASSHNEIPANFQHKPVY